MDSIPNTEMEPNMKRVLRHPFLVLLLALVLLLVLYPILRDVLDAPVLFDALITIVFLAAMPVIFKTRHLRALALFLGAPSLIGVWTGYFLPGLPRAPLAVAFHAFAVLFFAFTIVTILGTILRAGTVTADGIYGALCGYLLVGLAFAHVYCIIESVIPGSFRGDEKFMAQIQAQHDRQFLLSYFSFITLTTVGYGDIVPTSASARSVAVVEAILGQFYIAVLLAQLIGMRVAHALSTPQSDASGNPSGPRNGT
jgi:hypothetical protein